MNFAQIIFKPGYGRIVPSLNEVVSLMGYVPGSEPSYIPGMLDLLLKEAANHVTAGGCYSIFEIEEINIPQGLITHKSGSLKCGTKIAMQMAGSDYFALFIATAGNNFDNWVKSKSDSGDILAEYVCSTIGSVIAEKVADLVQSEINITAANLGKGITNRFSPGYCGWNVREQRSIFDLLPAEKIGVSLTPVFLMKPVKSVSGIIGIGYNKKPGPYLCDQCNMTNCLVKKSREL
jgi:hypothetical protein